VVFPVHPRTRRKISEFHFDAMLDGVRVIEPASFLDMIALEQAAAVIVTDSGGVQKEAFFFNVPCVTLREETEWVETVSAGANMLAGADATAIVAGARRMLSRDRESMMRIESPYGHGNAAQRIRDILIT